jgi:hypothetical protein
MRGSFDAVLSEMVLESHRVLPATFTSEQHQPAGLRGSSPLRVFLPFLRVKKAAGQPRLEWQKENWHLI